MNAYRLISSRRRDARPTGIGPRAPRRAISLLEVVLALAILAVASAYLAQSMHIASVNAERSETQTHAEIVAESVMNQVVAGLLPPQSVSWTAYVNPNPFGVSAALSSDTQWMYSISSLATEVQGMIGVQVAVAHLTVGQTEPMKADFYVNRWMIDPSLGLDTPPTTEEELGATSSSTSANGTTSTGGAQ